MRIALALCLLMSNLGLAAESELKWGTGEGRNSDVACESAREQLNHWARPLTEECETEKQGEGKLIFLQTYINHFRTGFVCRVLGAFNCKIIHE